MTPQLMARFLETQQNLSLLFFYRTPDGETPGADADDR